MKSYQVVGIGNAIVDVFTTADDSFIELMGIEKGIIRLDAAGGRRWRERICVAGELCGIHHQRDR